MRMATDMRTTVSTRTRRDPATALGRSWPRPRSTRCAFAIASRSISSTSQSRPSTAGASARSLLADAGPKPRPTVLGLVIAWAAPSPAVLGPTTPTPRRGSGPSILAAFATRCSSSSRSARSSGRPRQSRRPVPVHNETVDGSWRPSESSSTWQRRALLRGRPDDLNITRRLPAHGLPMPRLAGVVVSAGTPSARLDHARCRDQPAHRRSSWSAPGACFAIRALMFDGVPARSISTRSRELRRARRGRRERPAQSVATGTEVALTAHLVTPAGHPDDAFFRAAAARLRERFAIGHVTLQAATEVLMAPCEGPAPQKTDQA